MPLSPAERAEIASLQARTEPLVERRRLLGFLASAPFVLPLLATIVVSRDALAQGQTSDHSMPFP